MHAYVYLLHVLLLNKKKLIDIGKITAHLYFNVTKNTVRIHLFSKRLTYWVFPHLMLSERPVLRGLI